MNNSLIKFLGIFLIFLFCFSPLGAIDLNQGDNSTHINDKDNNSAQIIDNNTDFKDLNGTVIVDDDSSHDDDDNDMEIKSDNGTDDKKAVDYDVEIQNVTVNDSNSSKNLQKINPKVSMECEDSVYGESAILKIIFANKECGYWYDQRAVLYSYEDRHEEAIWIDTLHQGCNVIKLREDLPPGTYHIRYGFKGGDYFDDAFVTTEFTVHKRDPAINCSIKDIDYGKKPVLNVYKGDSFDAEGDYVYVSSPQFSQKYKIHVTGKPISFELDENLAAGRYTCDVVYPGDSIHNSQNTTVTFDVKKLDPNLTVDAKDSILQGENLDIEIRANKAVNADVTCKLGA